MIKQLEIFHDLCVDFMKDNSIESVLLTGSVAQGTASEASDLDLIIIGQNNDFKSHLIAGIQVEIHYTTYDTAIEKLRSNPKEIYKYLDAKIEYDNGNAQKIIEYAENIMEHYCVSSKEISEIIYWLNSTKTKLKSAFSKQDTLLCPYIIATNTWKVLEGIWAANQRPIPPSSSLYRRYRDLEFFPCMDWFEGLLLGNIESRGEMMLKCIDWILAELPDRTSSGLSSGAETGPKEDQYMY